MPIHGPAAGLGRVARRLTVVNLLTTLASVATSTLQARALGPSGRGDLAAVTVVVTLVSSLGSLGLASFVVRESAVGVPVRRLIGSIGPLLISLGICWAVAGPAIARLVAGDRQTVYWSLLIMLFAMPVVMFTSATTAIVWGQQRWRLFTIQQLVVPIGSAVVYGALFILGDLTVATAAITFGVLGIIISALPGLRALRGAGRPEWSSALARRGTNYGLKVWLTALANQTNARLDQLLMTRLVRPSQLGLYVVAVNVSLIQIAFTAALSTALLPRVAAGEGRLAAQALRISVALTALTSATLVLTVPVFLPLIFGPRFSTAVGMCQILAVAAVPFGALQVMTNVLSGLGFPGIAARGELISVGITVPALVAFVARYGGEGAAVISVVAYTCTAAYMAFYLRRHLKISWSAMFVVRVSDLTVVKALPGVRRGIGRRRR